VNGDIAVHETLYGDAPFLPRKVWEKVDRHLLSGRSTFLSWRRERAVKAVTTADRPNITTAP
jgi:hypothetical protein